MHAVQNKPVVRYALAHDSAVVRVQMVAQVLEPGRQNVRKLVALANLLMELAHKTVLDAVLAGTGSSECSDAAIAAASSAASVAQAFAVGEAAEAMAGADRKIDWMSCHDRKYLVHLRRSTNSRYPPGLWPGVPLLQPEVAFGIVFLDYPAAVAACNDAAEQPAAAKETTANVGLTAAGGAHVPG